MKIHSSFLTLIKILKLIFADFQTSLLTLFFVMLSFGQFQRIQLAGNIAFYLHDGFITLFLISFLTQKYFQNIFLLKDFFLTHWKNFRWEIIFIFWIIGGMVLGWYEGRITLKSLLYLARLTEYILFAWSLTQAKIAYAPWKGFLWAGTMIGFWGLLQYIFIPDVRFLNLFGWDVHYYRLVSTLLDPAFTGMILVFTLGLWQYWTHVLEEKHTNEKKLFLGIQAFLVIAIAASFSRASYLALSFFLTTQFFLNRKKWHFTFLSILFLASVFFLPKPGGEGVNLARTSTIEARAENVQENLIPLQGTEWIWGRGLFNSDAHKESFTHNHAQLPDSLPILLLNATGILGTLLASLLGGKWLKVSWKQDKLWTILLIATLIHSLFNNTLLQPFVFLFLWGSRKKT